jgi:uncharacterized membrane protein
MKNNIKKIAYTIGAGALAIPAIAGAANGYMRPENPGGVFEGDVAGVLTTILNYILGIIGIVAILGIVIGGLMYVISGGDETKTKDAKGIIFASIIGLVIALVGYAIVNTISIWLGF